MVMVYESFSLSPGLSFAEMQKLAKHEAEVAKKGGGGGSLDALGRHDEMISHINLNMYLRYTYMYNICIQHTYIYI